MRATSTRMLCLALLSSVALLLAPVAAVEPPVEIDIEEDDRYVYPLLDGADYQFGYSYQLSRDANVTTTVRDAAGSVVRVVTDRESEGVPTGGIFGYHYWDLRDEDDNPAPSGAYTLTMTAVDSSGNTSTDSVELGIDRRARPTITAVTSSRGDAVAAAFAPPADLLIESVRFAVMRGDHACVIQPAPIGADGSFAATFKLTPCAMGAHTLVGDIRWRDPLGYPHDIVSVGRPISVVDATAPAIIAPRSQAGIMNSPTTYPTFVMPLTVTDSSALRATSYWITDAAGRTVRSVRAIEMVGYLPRTYRGEFSWNGRTDAGALVPPGRYTVNIRSRDIAGNERIVRTTKIDLMRMSGGTLAVKPVTGAPNRFRATVTLAPGLVGSVTINGLQAEIIPGTQRWTLVLDFEGRQPGPTRITGLINWYDADTDTSGYFATAPVQVTVTDTKPPDVRPQTEVETMLLADPTRYSAAFVQYDAYDASGIAECRVWATDTAGTVVMSPRPIDRCGTFHYYNWQGVGDAGKPLPSGTYRLHTRFTDAGGLATTDVRTFVLDGRIPAEISAVPDPEDPDVFDVTVTPVAGAILTRASVHGERATRDDAGVFRVRLDLTESQATSLTAEVGWQTSLTPASVSGHFETAPLPLVRTDNEAPRATDPETHYSYLERADAYEPISMTFPVVERHGMKSAEYWITGPDGGVVVPRRSFEEINSPRLYWLAADAAGAPLPQGTYTAHARFEDLAGHVTEGVTANIVLGRVVPAELTSPSGGAPVSGRQLIVVAPRPGIEIVSTSVYFRDRVSQSSPSGVTIYNPSPDGTWHGGYDTSYLSAGTVRYLIHTTWRDPRGLEQEYVGEGTIQATGPPPVAAPTAVAATAANQTVRLTWTAPEGRLNGYVVEWAPPGGAWSRAVVPATAREHTIRDLRNGTSYQVRVRATTRYVQSDPSPALSRTPRAGPPAPVATVATALRRAAKVSWRPGKVLATHQAPTAFVVQTRRSGGAWRTVRVVGPSATWITVRDLTAGQSHLFRVVARNATGSTPGATVTVRPLR